MKPLAHFIIIFNLILATLSLSGVRGNATTTIYHDGRMGACGCGSLPDNEYLWQLGISPGLHTAAANLPIFGASSMPEWCGSGCGSCYRLTSKGNPPCGKCGTAGKPGMSIMVMVTNLCPFVLNEQWCPTSGLNDYGYEYHFDIMAESNIIGDNPVVEFERVDCPQQALKLFERCWCAHAEKDHWYGEEEESKAVSATSGLGIFRTFGKMFRSLVGSGRHRKTEL